MSDPGEVKPVQLRVLGVAKRDGIKPTEKMTVADVLKAGGVDLEKMKSELQEGEGENIEIKGFNITVNGNEADLDTVIEPGDLVVAVPDIDQG